MAKLTPEQAIQLILAPVNKDNIQNAILQEDRLLFHCEPVQSKDKLSRAYDHHISWVSSFLPKEKLSRYIPLLTTPVETVQSTKTIFNELSKVYQADDRFIKFDFVSDEIEQDANEYASKIKDEEFWKTEGFKALKIGICSLVVVDLPTVQIGDRPEPYYYLVKIKNVVDLEFFEDGKVPYLIFKRKDGKVVGVDELSYMVFEQDDSGTWKLFGDQAFHSAYNEVTGEVTDGLGYAPACSFYDNAISGTGNINKNGPVTDALSKLDWLLFWRVSKKYFELYATWPIMVSYKRKCDYQDKDGNECREGFVNYMIGSDTHQMACPVCSKQSILGPGTKWQVDPPRDKDDVDLMENPIKFIEVTSDKLEFVTTELERLENEVYLDCVGWDGDAMSKQAVNDDQVAANLVSKEAVLDTIREQLQKAQKFAMQTVFIVRYGSYYLKGVVDWGNNYFLKSEAEITSEYTAAKSAGLPSYMIADLRDKVNRTANKNNPERLLRNQILEQLEPYLDYKASELTSLGVQDRDQIGYIIKLNFNNFIQRFEREQMDIVQFGSLIDFNTKIYKIQQILNGYATEQKIAVTRNDAPAA